MLTFDIFWGSLLLVSLGTQVQSQMILDPDCLPDYLSVSYEDGKSEKNKTAVLMSISCFFNKNKTLLRETFFIRPKT